MVLLNEVPNPQQYGVVELTDGKVSKLVEKPKEPKSNLALVGVYLFDSNIFKAVNEIKPSWRNELEITDAIQWLVDANLRVDPHIITDWWKDTGKPEDMLEANRIILEAIKTKVEGQVSEDSSITGNVIIGKGSTVENSVIRGPVIIGSESKISNAYIGPFTAVGNNAIIHSAEVENSILMDEIRLENVDGRIDNSLLGRGVKIQSRNRRPKAFSFVLGDRSEVEL